MNLPNKLTVVRMILIIPFVWCMMLTGTAAKIAALVIFCVASATDYFDGRIARQRNLVTNFGKFLDPIADKLLVMSALVMLTEQGTIPGVVTILIIGRELIVSAFRQIAAANGTILAAGKLGKIKTVTQMIALIAALALRPKAPELISLLFGIATVMTVWSGIDYIVRNRQVISDR